MSWLAELIPQPQSREALNTLTFFRDIVSPFICYYASAILVLVPNTRPIRLAVLPFSLWTLFNAATRLDLVKAYSDERLAYLNMGLAFAYSYMSLRLVVWSIQKRPYWRVSTRRDVAPVTKPPTFVTKQVFVDALELCCNPRGCGWNWSREKETHLTGSTTNFAVTTLTSMIAHAVVLDFLQYTILWIEPTTSDPVRGGSIFKHSLPPLLRYSRSSLLTLIVGVAAYCTIQMFHDMGALVGVLLFKQDTALWPPFFNAPWLSVSLTEFWAKRWHQVFRDPFITLGYKPLTLIFGRAVGVLGVFAISGILHFFGQWGLGHGTDPLLMIGYFVMNGVGVVLESAWRSVTGRKVGGWPGRIWTMLWVIGWSHMFAEALSTRGVFGSVFLPQEYRPATHVLGPLLQHDLGGI